MSCSNSSSCKTVSNNKYTDCPPRMDDGRHFTDYRPICHVNNMVRANNSISNSYEYRMFLTKNAEKLMDMNRAYSCQKNCSSNCKQPYNQGTMLPEQSMQICDNRSCNTDFINHQGLGLGRKYNTHSTDCGFADMNNGVASSNCCADKNALFNYYGQIDSSAQGKPATARPSMPSGGELLKGGPEPYNL